MIKDNIFLGSLIRNNLKYLCKKNMRLIQLISLICVLGLPIHTLFAQISIQEEGLIITHLDHQIKLDFKDIKGSMFNVKAYDVNTNQDIRLEQDDSSINSYILNDIHPAQILKIEFGILNGSDSSFQTKYLASISASSGDIKVYFNHPVDTSFKQTHASINLSSNLDDTLINYINRCDSTLDMAIYNSYSPSSITGIAGAINAAHSRGVRVRIIYDGSTSSSMIPLISSAIPKLASPNSIAYGIMHNKFVIFDANSSNPDKAIVWTGSTNWTGVQIDGPDKNNVIIFQDQSLALAYKIEFEEMWGGSGSNPTSNSKFGPNKTNNTPHSFVIGGKTVESYFSPSDGTNAKIIDAIGTGDSDVNIAIMVVTRTDIKDALLNKFNSGVTNISLIVDTQNPSGNQFPTIQTNILPDHGVVCGLSGIMHHKFMVVDNFADFSDPLVLTGSHNWSNSAETKNDENTVIVHDANIANQYYQAFAYLYEEANGIIDTTTSINDEATSLSGIVMYPNPAQGILNLEDINASSMHPVSINIVDMFGKPLFSKHYARLTKEQIDLSQATSGIYFVEVRVLNKNAFYKIIKN